MKLARIYLVITGVIFTGFGLYCLLDPLFLSEATGLILSTPTSTIEVIAMYGGLQTTMGLYLLYCSLQQNRVAQALLVSVFIFAGVAGARAYGLATHSGDTGYNFMAAIYEIISGLIALWLLQTRTTRSHEDEAR